MQIRTSATLMGYSARLISRPLQVDLHMQLAADACTVLAALTRLEQCEGLLLACLAVFVDWVQDRYEWAD